MKKRTRWTTESIIVAFINKYGDRFDYSKVVYQAMKKKILIYCKEHDEWFEQAVWEHLHGNPACPKCKEQRLRILGDSQKTPLEELKERGFVQFEGKISYHLISETDYKNGRDKVKFFCNEHSLEFRQSVSGHLAGKIACPICLAEKHKEIGLKQRLTQEEFEQKVYAVHGDLYGLEESIYVTNYQKVKVFCRRCNEYFMIAPANLMGGKHCFKCSHRDRGVAKSLPKEEVTTRIDSVIPEYYEYDINEFVSVDKKMTFTCHKHKNTFQQIPWDVFFGKTGCRDCYLEKVSGENNHHYIDGRSKQRDQERFSPEYHRWRKQVISDVEVCDKCGKAFKEGVSKVAHHLDAWRDFPEKRFDPDNGTCLCQECHCQFHSLFGSGDNTKEDYLLFKVQELKGQEVCCG